MENRRRTLANEVGFDIPGLTSIEQEAARIGFEILRQNLARLDPNAANRLTLDQIWNAAMIVSEMVSYTLEITSGDRTGSGVGNAYLRDRSQALARYTYRVIELVRGGEVTVEVGGARQRITLDLTDEIRSRAMDLYNVLWREIADQGQQRPGALLRGVAADVQRTPQQVLGQEEQAFSQNPNLPFLRQQ
jgi:hypothetical protein